MAGDAAIANTNGIGAIGAFDGNDLVGFAMSIPGTRGGNPYLHSHMLALRRLPTNLYIEGGSR